jgi:hypothetical protein
MSETKYRSQKARGVMAHPVYGEMVPRPIVIQDLGTDSHERVEAYLALCSDRSKRAFARPAPELASHGFADSREIGSYTEFLQVWQESSAADARAEVILMPFFEATWNAVLTPTSVAIGPGHDGATAGAGSVTFGLADVDLDAFGGHTGEGEVPYIEAVANPLVIASDEDYGWKAKVMEVKYVQVRAGPPQGGFGDYIPEAVTVKSVLRAEGDALEWAAKIADLGVTGESGVVVWHPTGGRSAHYAIHCMLHKIPIVFGSVAPTVGDLLARKKEGKNVWRRSQVRRGVSAGLTHDLKSRKAQVEAVQAICFGLYQAGGLRKSKEGAFVLGFVSALMLRLGYAACIGEMRHAAQSDLTDALSRRQIFTRIFSGKWGEESTAWKNLVGTAWYAFDDMKWNTSSFGGKKWAGCTESAVALEAALKAACTGEDPKGVALVEALNVCVNMAHNGGKWLNKFAPASLYDTMGNHGNGPEPRKTMEAAMTVFRVIRKRVRGGPALVERFVQEPPIVKVDLGWEGDYTSRVVHPDAPEGSCSQCYELESACECCSECGYYGDDCECCAQCGESGGNCDCCTMCEETYGNCDCCSDCQNMADDCCCHEEDEEDVIPASLIHVPAGTCLCGCGLVTEIEWKVMSNHTLPTGTVLTPLSTVNKRIQFAKGPKGRLHFQSGLPQGYRSTDIIVCRADIPALEAWISTLALTTSLAATDRVYHIIPKTASLPYTVPPFLLPLLTGWFKTTSSLASRSQCRRRSRTTNSWGH